MGNPKRNAPEISIVPPFHVLRKEERTKRHFIVNEIKYYETNYYEMELDSSRVSLQCSRSNRAIFTEIRYPIIEPGF